MRGESFNGTPNAFCYLEPGTPNWAIIVRSTLTLTPPFDTWSSTCWLLKAMSDDDRFSNYAYLASFVAIKFRSGRKSMSNILGHLIEIYLSPSECYCPTFRGRPQQPNANKELRFLLIFLFIFFGCFSLYFFIIISCLRHSSFSYSVLSLSCTIFCWRFTHTMAFSYFIYCCCHRVSGFWSKFTLTNFSRCFFLQSFPFGLCCTLKSHSVGCEIILHCKHSFFYTPLKCLM